MNVPFKNNAACCKAAFGGSNSIPKVIFSGILVIAIIFPGLMFASPEEEIKGAVSACKELASKNLDQSAGMDQDELLRQLLLGHFCTEPEISSRLDANERNRIQDIARRFQEAKKSLPKKKLANVERIEEYLKVKWETEVRKGRTNEEKELVSLDAQLRSIWEKMIEALRKKDVDQAVTYFARKTRESYRKTFSAIIDRLPALADELEDIQLVRIRTPREVEYDLRSFRDGNSYSYQLIFIREADDQWRILSY